MNVSLATLSLTRNLQTLAEQIDAAPKLFEEIRAAMRQPDIDFLVGAKMRGHRHMTSIAMTTQRIKLGVLGIDDLGMSLESLSELVLRAIRLVVLSELTILRTLWHGREHLEQRSPRIEARVGDIDAVDTRLRNALDSITHSWCQFRGLPNPDRAAYRSSLRAAHRVTRALAADHDIAAFLNGGSSRIEWPAFRESCTRLRDALLVHIDVEPDAALLDHADPRADLRTEHGL